MGREESEGEEIGRPACPHRNCWRRLWGSWRSPPRPAFCGVPAAARRFRRRRGPARAGWTPHRRHAFGLAPLPLPRPAATESLPTGPAAGLEGAAAAAPATATAAPGTTAAAAAPGATRNGRRAGGQGVGRGPDVGAALPAGARVQENEGDALSSDCKGGPALSQVRQNRFGALRSAAMAVHFVAPKLTSASIVREPETNRTDSAHNSGPGAQMAAPAHCCSSKDRNSKELPAPTRFVRRKHSKTALTAFVPCIKDGFSYSNVGEPTEYDVDEDLWSFG
jgi:hypothetical protein